MPDAVEADRHARRRPARVVVDSLTGAPLRTERGAPQAASDRPHGIRIRPSSSPSNGASHYHGAFRAVASVHRVRRHTGARPATATRSSDAEQLGRPAAGKKRRCPAAGCHADAEIPGPGMRTAGAGPGGVMSPAAICPSPSRSSVISPAGRHFGEERPR
jgi:hypothetical protein